MENPSEVHPIEKEQGRITRQEMVKTVNKMFDSDWQDEYSSNDFRSMIASVNFIRGEGGDLTLEAEIPDFDKKELALEIEDNCLVLQGKKTDNSEMFFNKAFPVPEETDRENIEADFIDGMLTVRMTTGDTSGGNIDIQIN